jgi:hypothetical protein
MSKLIKILGIALVIIGAGAIGYFYFFSRNASDITAPAAISSSPLSSTQVNSNISEKPSAIKDGETCGAYRYTKPSGSDSQKMNWLRRGSVTLVMDSDKNQFMLCGNGKALQSKINASGDEPGQSDEYSIVELSEDSLQDLDGDGNLEIVLFVGQCVEGPCLGEYHLYRSGTTAITKLQTMPGGYSGGALNFIHSGNRLIALVHERCFTYDFGIFFEVLKILEWDATQKWVRISAKYIMQNYQPIVNQYAETSRARLAKFSERANLENNTDMLGLNVQILLAHALQGEKEEVIMKAYDELLIKYVPEALKDPNFPVAHCNPRELLKSLCEEIRTGQVKPESALDER